MSTYNIAMLIALIYAAYGVSFSYLTWEIQKTNIFCSFIFALTWPIMLPLLSGIILYSKIINARMDAKE